jgi:hypothetical protein
MNFKNVIKFVVNEAENILKTSATKPIVDAIKNRRKITFEYYGPRTPKKDSVRPGKRTKVEPVALGLSKKGNLIIRAWVQPPSVSKTGFQKGNWRTFILSRTRNVEITDETFDTKRPQYKEGNDKSMSVTYVTSDWISKPRIKKYEKPSEKPKPVSKIEPIKKDIKKIEPKKVEPTPKELPQPKPKEKPEPLAKIEPKKVEPTPKELPQLEPEKKPEVEKPEELPQPKSKEKPKKNPEDEENKTISEEINRIKTLMLI